MKHNENKNNPFDVSFEWDKNLDKVKSELAKASPSYCLAKWAHSTIHFHLGSTHSCYNVPLHQIPKDQLQQNPSSIHNTPIKIEQRRAMKNGTRPADCAYCWNIEDLNAENKSDRIIQSASSWAYPGANEIYGSNLGENISPRYLEVSFSNVCNFKCSYCSSLNSSSWAEEIRKHGPYKIGYMQQPPEILQEDNNPYIQAFRDWWPTLKHDLKVFRITGGEPLLSKNTWQILDNIENDPLPHLHLSINSNLGVSDATIDKFIQKIKSILDKNAIGRMTVFTSIEATGQHAEFIRHGLDTRQFFKNIEKILAAVPSLRVSIMSTFCALSIFSYQDLLKKVIELRKVYSNHNSIQRIGISTNYLRFPQYLSVRILPPSMDVRLEEIFKYMNQHQYHPENYDIGFTRQEISLFDNLRQWFKTPMDEQVRMSLQKDFMTFFQEHDARRGTNLFQTFPELNDLF